jgi:hypothetical protein
MNDDDTTLIRGNDTPPPADRGERGRMRACDADRDHVVELLNVAYSEGRLSKDEYDGRLEHALSARTYADLDQIVTDLPAAHAVVVSEIARDARHHALSSRAGSAADVYRCELSSAGELDGSGLPCSGCLVWPGFRGREGYGLAGQGAGAGVPGGRAGGLASLDERGSGG